MYHEPDIVTGVAATLMVLDANSKWYERTNVKTYTAKCACGWQGPPRTREHEADDDVYHHRITENDQ